MKVKLVILNGKGNGREIPLPSTLFIIGRDAICHLRPHSTKVSKLHCAISRNAGQVLVRDLKSSNRTFINHQPISRTVRVKNGDVLTVGPLQFRFVITNGNAGSPRQTVREDQVRWLLEDCCNLSEGDSGADTVVIEIPPDLMSGDDDPPPENHSSEDDSEDDVGSPKEECDSGSLSAGEYLREYFRRQREGGTR